MDRVARIRKLRGYIAKDLVDEVKRQFDFIPSEDDEIMSDFSAIVDHLLDYIERFEKLRVYVEHAMMLGYLGEGSTSALIRGALAELDKEYE